jgi:PAS domain-containing protein
MAPTVQPGVPPASLPPAASDIFGSYDRIIAFASAVIVMLAISAIDKLTGFEMRLQILYLIPVAIATWSVGRAWGLTLAAASVGIWLAIFATTHNYSSNLYHYWDGAVWFVTLAVFVLLLSRLHEELDSSNANLVEVFEHFDSAVYVLDPDSNAILYRNRRFRERYGEAPEDTLRSWAAQEYGITWPDGRRAVVRILS